MAQWDVVASEHLDTAQRIALRSLWDEAFAGRFTDADAEHAYGGVHAIAWADPTRQVALAHGSVVPRLLRVGAQWHRAGYVEAVAVSTGRQRQGFGTVVLRLLAEQTAERWPFAMLSTGAPAFYERLGWQRWQGLSMTVRADGSQIADGEHEGLMVLSLGSGIDLAAEVACEERSGDAW